MGLSRREASSRAVPGGVDRLDDLPVTKGLGHHVAVAGRKVVLAAVEAADPGKAPPDGLVVDGLRVGCVRRSAHAPSVNGHAESLFDHTQPVRGLR